MTRLHTLVGDQLDEDVEVVVGIETDHGPWVPALLAAGYTVPWSAPRVRPVPTALRARQRRHAAHGEPAAPPTSPPSQLAPPAPAPPGR